MKLCNTCRELKPYDEYYKKIDTKDGYRNDCKACFLEKKRKAREEADQELVEENIKLARKTQGAQDRNRIANKAFREKARYENAVTEYSRELVNVLNGYEFKTSPKRVETVGATGVMHLTDLHFNELVDLAHNKYDFTIAGKRLRMYAHKAMRHFRAEGISNVFIAFTADLMNSDRRLDELLAMATNRARATVLAVDILSQLIIEVAEEFNVTVGWVCGNEGRVGRELGFQEEMASDNYDETIMRTLALLFKDSERVEFVKPTDPLELVVEISGQNLLLIHGHSFGKDIEKGVHKVVAKYSAQGVKIDYVISGHLHMAFISDIFARGSSPVGDNAYSSKGLNLYGRASQNFYVFYENGNRDGIKVDLQHYKCVAGYETDKTLHSYNIKSAEKARPHTTIHRIVI